MRTERWFRSVRDGVVTVTRITSERSQVAPMPGQQAGDDNHDGAALMTTRSERLSQVTQQASDDDHVWARNPKDALVMYIVVPRSLKMSAGKVGATCGHAAQLLMQRYWDVKERHGSDREDCRRMVAWLETSYPKIVLGASDEEFQIVRHLDGAILVVDIGLKEVAPGSVTAVSFWPVRKTNAPTIIQGLRPL